MTNLNKPFRQNPPAKVGDSIEEMETPALVVELASFETNLKLMKEKINEHKLKNNLTELKLRPHYKTHKCPSVALKQLEIGGATGVCCAKITEVESLVFGSQSDTNWDILLTNEIVSKPKLNRLVAIAKQIQSKPNHPLLAVCVDHKEHINDLIAVCDTSNVQFNVYVEVNVGQHRGGVDEPEQVLELVQTIQTSKNLKFLGIHAYNGANQHVRSYEERKSTVLGTTVKGKLQAVKQLLEKNNIQVENITGAGTGTFQFEIESGVYNEIQAGSYAFMDVDYSINHKADGTYVDEFEQSLFIYSRIQNEQMQSKVYPRLMCDAGLKSTSLDSGLPKVSSPKGLKYISQGDEHGMLVPDNDNHLSTFDHLSNTDAMQLNKIVRLIPGHCDPTINMHDYIVAVRDGIVEQVWPIEGRGPGY